MRRYVQAFFRHRLLLILPIFLALSVSIGYQARQPRSYQASVSLWADTPVPNQSAIFSGAAPSASHSAVLGELLQTRAFLSKVGQNSSHAPFLADHPGPDGDVVLFALATDISVITPGPHLLTIATRGATSNEAVALAKATGDAYIAEVNASQSARAKSSVAYFQAQVDDATSALATAKSKLSQYLQANQGSGPLGAPGDATVAQLTLAVSVAQGTYDQAAAHSSDAGIGLLNITDSGVLRIFDPARAGRPVGRKKKLIFSGVAGLFAGGMVSLFALLFLVVSDRSVQGPAEIEDVLGMQVVGRIDEFRTKVRPARMVS